MSILRRPRRSRLGSEREVAQRRHHPAIRDPRPRSAGADFRIRVAARTLGAGGVVAYPTEAVYGLGCDPWNGDAVRRVLAIKQRPERKGLILIAADLAQIEPFVEPLEPPRMSEILSTWPGPVTWLLPARPETPAWLTGDHDTLAVRVTAHPLAAALCRTAGSALVSTSANRGGLAPARTALQVRLKLAGEVDYILGGACGKRGQPSTIRDARTGAVIRA
jgi:L-threonylcarbamoyladenylate synthase